MKKPLSPLSNAHGHENVSLLSFSLKEISKHFFFASLFGERERERERKGERERERKRKRERQREREKRREREMSSMHEEGKSLSLFFSICVLNDHMTFKKKMV